MNAKNILIIVLTLIVGFGVSLSFSFLHQTSPAGRAVEVAVFSQLSAIEPSLILPIYWNDIGYQMVKKGVIDVQKLERLYAERPEELRLIRSYLQPMNQPLVMSSANAGVLLNLFWAFGLANHNAVLAEGPMTDARYVGNSQPGGSFASTGGWSLAVGDPMTHYGRHVLVMLNPEEQSLVDRIAKSIYRPCCDNSTYFPDCNHGMAMLALIELLVDAGVGESEIYDIALRVNQFWFPENYATIGKYFKKQGIEWGNVDAKTVLGREYSSASGYRLILTVIDSPAESLGGSCSV